MATPGHLSRHVPVGVARPSRAMTSGEKLCPAETLIQIAMRRVPAMTARYAGCKPDNHYFKSTTYDSRFGGTG